MFKNKTGVVVVDLQGDFTLLKQGSLAVQQTDQSYLDDVVDTINQFHSKGYKLFATQDFHPENHISFYTNHKNKKPYEAIEIEGRTQVLWPPHCIQGSENTRLLVDENLFIDIVQKGTDPGYDSYSGFFDDNGMKTGLEDCLKYHGLNTLVVFGLATDYCVKATAMDALGSGFKVILIKDLCRGVAAHTTTRALEEMAAAGVRIISSVSKI